MSLLSRDAVHRALVFAGSAVGALFRIDLVRLFPLRDRVFGADFGAGATRDAFIRIDYPRHVFLLEHVGMGPGSVSGQMVAHFAALVNLRTSAERLSGAQALEPPGQSRRDLCPREQLFAPLVDGEQGAGDPAIPRVEHAK